MKDKMTLIELNQKEMIEKMIPLIKFLHENNLFYTEEKNGVFIPFGNFRFKEINEPRKS